MGDLSPGQPPTMASFLTLTCSQRFFLFPLREERTLSLSPALSLSRSLCLASLVVLRILEPRADLDDEMELEMKMERRRRRRLGGRSVGQAERDGALSGFVYEQSDGFTAKSPPLKPHHRLADD